MKSDSTHTRWEADTFPDIQSRSKSSYFVLYLPYKSSGFHTRVRIWWLLVLHFPSDSFIAYTNSYWKSWQTDSNSGVFKVMKWNCLPSERRAGLGTALCLLWGLSRNKTLPALCRARGNAPVRHSTNDVLWHLPQWASQRLKGPWIGNLDWIL